MTEDNNNEIKEEIKPEISVDTENIEAEPESKDIKMLEEKEHYELEYFSKDECEKELTDLKAKVEKLQKETEHFAKRQMTWFKRDKRIKWTKNYQEAKNLIKNF